MLPMRSNLSVFGRDEVSEVASQGVRPLVRQLGRVEDLYQFSSLHYPGKLF
jgi:hypothetical protein